MNDLPLLEKVSENTKKTQITIDKVEYQLEDLTPEQQVLFQHCIDLDRKINNTKFQLDQLSVGKQGFYNMLKESLAVEKVEVEIV
jgi:uncharacterized protein YoxC